MVALKTLKAYRIKQEWLDEVAALPYDVMTIAEAKEIVKNKPYSFLHIDKPEIHDFNRLEDTYEYAHQQLMKLIHEEVYIQDEESLYIYELQKEKQHQYGLVGLVAAQDYLQGKMIQHEKTRLDKLKDREQHILHCQAHTGPIYLIDAASKDLGKQLAHLCVGRAPILQNTFEDGVIHRIYQIKEKMICQLFIQQFQEVENLYIADGHHRSGAAAQVAMQMPNCEEAQYFLAVIFPEEQLQINAYHRLLKDETGKSKEQLLSQLAQHFKVTPLRDTFFTPSRPHILGMCLENKWYQLEVKPSIYKGEEISQTLDVTLLQQYILEPLFGIKEPRSDARLQFMPAPQKQQLVAKLQSAPHQVAFTLYPVQMTELLAIAEAGGQMPPKSTWFEPKLRSGIWIHTF